MYGVSEELAAAGVRVFESGRVSYPERYSVYAALYGEADRTIRSWVAHGKKVGALPPLHDPAALATWWKSHRKNSVPRQILDLAFQARKDKESEIELPKVTASAPEDDEKKGRFAPVEVSPDLSGADEALRQSREMASAAYKKMRDAERAGEVTEVAMWREEWSSLVETQRKWEKDFNRIQEDRGLLVRKSTMQVEVSAVASVLQRAFLASMESLLKRHCPDLPPAERRRIAVKQRDRCFDVLQSGYFGENLFSENEPAAIV